MALLEKWSKFMTDGNWSHTIDKEKNLIFFNVSNEIATLRMNIIIREDDDCVILIQSYEKHCPEKFRTTMLDFANRVNFAIPIGFFSVDMKDGEVRYRNAIDVEGIEITKTFVENFIKSGVVFSRRYYSPIQAIMNGSPIETALAITDK